MNSTDLDWASETDALERELWRQAITFASEFPNRAGVIGRLRAFIKQRLVADAPGSIEELPIPESCPAPLKIELREVAAGRRGSPRSVEAAAAWVLFASAVSEEVIAFAPCDRAVSVLFEPSANSRFYFECLHSALGRAADQSHATRDAWVDFLARVVPDLAGRIQAHSKLAVVEVASGWARNDDPFAIFDANYRRGRTPYSSEVESIFARLSMLWAISRRDWAAAVDALPLPQLMWDVVHLSRVSRESELFGPVLSSLPLVFDEKGNWTGSVVALLVSDTVVDHIRRTHNAVWRGTEDWGRKEPEQLLRRQRARARLAELESVELKRWALEAYSLLLARADGRFIAFEAMGRLARVLLIGDSNEGRHGNWSAATTALEALSDAMIDGRVSTTEIFSWWVQREAREARRWASSAGPDSSEGGRVLFAEGLSYLTGCIAMLIRMKERSAETDALADSNLGSLWDWATTLFVGRDPGLALAHNGATSAGYRYLGYLLSRLKDPTSAWAKAYSRLEGQRRRVAARGDSVPASGSADLVCCGLHACAFWRRDGGPVAHVHAFYKDLVHAARHLYLTASTFDQFEGASARLLADSFAFAPVVLSDGLVGSVTELLVPLANDPVLVRDALEALSRNGVTKAVQATIGERLGIDVEQTTRLADRIRSSP